MDGQIAISEQGGVLTLLILVVSEIIPKTIGATYARVLATPTSWMTWTIWTRSTKNAARSIDKTLRGYTTPPGA